MSERIRVLARSLLDEIEPALPELVVGSREDQDAAKRRIGTQAWDMARVLWQALLKLRVLAKREVSRLLASTGGDGGSEARSRALLAMLEEGLAGKSDAELDALEGGLALAFWRLTDAVDPHGPIEEPGSTPDPVVPDRWGTEDREAGSWALAQEERSDTSSVSVRVGVGFATNRKLEQVQGVPSRRYGSSRGELSLGWCEVAVPRDHVIGELEEPSLWRWEFFWDQTKHVTLLAAELLAEGEWLSRLRAELNTARREALLFVHGYRVSFADAARRTAQMKFDLQFPGPALFFSWPSKASFPLYTHDETEAEAAIPDLAKMLELVASQLEVERVHLVAHSMGTRCLTRSLQLLTDASQRAKFEEIILAAPDIDADVFCRQILPRLGGGRSRVTLYASSNDTALKASKKVHGFRRAGDSDPEILTADGLDSVDASAIKGDVLGHSYFAGTRTVLSDLHELLKHRRGPKDRFGLEERKTAAGQTYWRFKP
jgi:esterase/lipase superfamily enzyme